MHTRDVELGLWLSALVVLSVAAAAQRGRAAPQEKSAQGNAVYLPIVRRPPGQVYYGATTGSNANPGTKSQPWSTIQKAADTMAPWDTCIVRAGSYYERVQITQSGSSAGPIRQRLEARL